ncbi:MAG: response regulator [Candidatus Omnitrophota bacterium]
MGAKKKILLIDDEKDFCHFMSKNLEGTGEFFCLYATDPDRGIKLARSEVPDLILLDIRMPKKGGFKVLEVLKQDTKTMSIPVIMLTAVEDEESKLKAAELYNEDYVTKPVGWEAIRDRINKVFEIRGGKVSRLYPLETSSD